MKKQLVSILILSLIILPACQNEEEKPVENEKKEMVLRQIPVPVESINLSEGEGNITFKRSGKVEAEQSLNISPEISGKIVKLNFKEGDQVEKDEVIAEIGDSISTESLKIQRDNALTALDTSKKSLEISKNISEINEDNSQISTELNQITYSSNRDNKELTLDQLRSQEDTLLLNIKSAEENLDNSKNNLERAKDTLDELEEELEDYYDAVDDEEIPKNDQLESELESAISQSEAQVDNARFAKNSAEITLNQAKVSLEQFRKTRSVQVNQLDTGLESSSKQIDLSENQEKITNESAAQQEVTAKNQIAQAENQLKLAELNLEKTLIKSPISGVITSLNINSGELVNPGQNIAKVENTQKMIVKTSISEEERELIEENDEVMVTYQNSEINGKILTIYPIVNSQTKKIDVDIILDSANIPAGSLVEVEFKIKSNNFFIPLSAVFLDQGQEKVRIVLSEKAYFRNVKTGLIQGSFVEITDGLNGNEIVLKNPKSFLEEKDFVTFD